MSQEQINELLVARGGRARGRAPEGRRPVRVRARRRGGGVAAGDAGVAFEVVPGDHERIAAPAYAGIPVTHRGLSTSSTIVTGHEDPPRARRTRLGGARAGGRHRRGAMGVGRLTEIAGVDRGRSRSRDAGRRGALGHTTGATHGAGYARDDRPPRGRVADAIVVGQVARLDLAWFERRPLFGRRIVVTRARVSRRASSGPGSRQLGADVIELPSIVLEPMAFALPALSDYAWLVFTSANGVDAFFDDGLAPAGFDRACARRRSRRRDRARHDGGARGAACGPISFPRVRRGVAARGVPGTGPSCGAGAARARGGGPRRAARRPRRARLRGRRARGVPSGAGSAAVADLERPRRARSTRSRSRRRRRSRTSATRSARSPARSRR